MKANDILVTLSKKYKGDWNAIMKAMKEKEHIDESECDKFDPSKEIAIIDGDYPQAFKNVNQPPFIIYFNGEKNLLCSPSIKRVGFVSDETDSKYTLKMAKRFGEAIAAMNAILVCRNVTAPERQCVESAIALGGKVIIPMRSATDNDTPNVTYVSEFPQGAEGNIKNVCKMVGALSNLLIVGEISAKQEGATSSLAFAIGLAKDVGAIPFESDYDNQNNKLIKAGALMIENASDIISALS